LLLSNPNPQIVHDHNGNRKITTSTINNINNKIPTPNQTTTGWKSHFQPVAFLRAKPKSAKMGGMRIAIYSLNINIKSRGKGQSAIASAAYIAGKRFKNEYDGITHDRTDRNDVVHGEIVLPENAPANF